jgi:thiamine biosynthesis lipoprotein
MKRLTVARNAMATRFEFVLVGEHETQLRAAGEEALEEIERVESRLSLYRSGSEIADINRRAGTEWVRLSPEVFALLTRAAAYWQLSGGSFDPTVAPLVRCWGFMKGSGSRPTDEEISGGRGLTGMGKVEFDTATNSVRFLRDGMMLDLGSIGKGYALDRAAEILRDTGVENALLHGGTSTILALGTDPEAAGWKVAIEDPRAEGEDKVLAVLELQDESLSVSTVWGKYFEIDGKRYGHVIDPRTGWPAENVLLGAVVLESAEGTDALSTAVLLASDAEIEKLAEKLPPIRHLQIREGQTCVRTRGIELRPRS